MTSFLRKDISIAWIEGSFFHLNCSMSGELLLWKYVFLPVFLPLSLHFLACFSNLRDAFSSFNSVCVYKRLWIVAVYSILCGWLEYLIHKSKLESKFYQVQTMCVTGSGIGNWIELGRWLTNKIQNCHFWIENH